MRYNAKKIDETRWAVFKNRTQYFTNTVTTDRAEAEAEAAERSAVWYLDKARELVPEMSLDGAKSVAAEFYQGIVYAVEERAREEDPDFNEMDPHGFLA